MVAFAANSLLCRLALGQGLIDAASFASVRVVAGAVLLAALAWPAWRKTGLPRADAPAILGLFAYLVLFAFAYISLSAGTGALILFGAVQVTMFAVALHSGERFRRFAWLGLALAVAGLIYLVAPGVTAPDPLGAVLMAGAGIAWGVYSLRGKGADMPLQATAANFVYCVPLCLAVSFLARGQWNLTPAGIGLAVASGAIASGLGYAVWYAALKGLSSGSAATVQLSVPVIAALGGVVLLAEPLTGRMVLSGTMVLGGIALVLWQQRKAA
jgi:drug/metabolite transporter (DMT)-like permease